MYLLFACVLFYVDRSDVMVVCCLVQGTMEEKIYERQVTKQSLSQRVVDEQQVARHFTSADLAELYRFTPSRWDADKDDYTPVLPKVSDY